MKYHRFTIEVDLHVDISRIFVCLILTYMHVLYL